MNIKFSKKEVSEAKEKFSAPNDKMHAEKEFTLRKMAERRKAVQNSAVNKELGNFFPPKYY